MKHIPGEIIPFQNKIHSVAPDFYFELFYNSLTISVFPDQRPGRLLLFTQKKATTTAVVMAIYQTCRRDYYWVVSAWGNEAAFFFFVA